MTKKKAKNGLEAGKDTQSRTAAAQLKERGTRKPDPQRMEILRGLPVAIKQSLTKEEADAILYEPTWPDSLLQKLKDYLVDENVH